MRGGLWSEKGKCAAGSKHHHHTTIAEAKQKSKWKRKAGKIKNYPCLCFSPLVIVIDKNTITNEATFAVTLSYIGYSS